MKDRWLTPEQVAEQLQVTEHTVYMWLRNGKLLGRKLGRLWRIAPSDLAAFLEKATPHTDVKMSAATRPEPEED